MITFPKFTTLVRNEAAVEEHTVTINHQDILRAELELKRNGIDARNATFHLTNAWIWAALMRGGVYAKPWQVFKDEDCVGYDDAGEEEIFPTVPAPGTPAITPDSGAGLTSS